MNRPLIMLGIDVEDWYQTMAFEKSLPAQDHDIQAGLARQGIEWLIESLAKNESSATFFINGYLAEREPALVALIAGAGHECACHGYHHRALSGLEPAAVIQEIVKATELISTLSGQTMHGFRAPNWSVTTDMTWLFESLLERGYTYDASIFPRKTPWFGQNMAHRENPDDHTPGLAQVFPAVLPLGPLVFPLGLGFIFRLTPFGLLRKSIHQLLRLQQPVLLNLHAWEVAGESPPFYPDLKARLLTGVALKKVRKKLTRVFGEFKTITIEQWLSARAAADEEHLQQ